MHYNRNIIAKNTIMKGGAGMWKSYCRDWQENVGYEDFLKNQSCDCQGKNEKAVKNGPVKIINTRYSENSKAFAQQ